MGITDDNTIIGKIITEYNQLVDRQQQLEKANKQLQGALRLTNIKILRGEKHSEESKSIVHSALFQGAKVNDVAYSDQYLKKREEIEKIFKEYLPIEKESEEFISPSGNYKLITIPYRTDKGHWDYTKGIIIDLKTEVIVFEVLRNYSSFWYKWIEHQNGKEYLLCGEDYQGYTVLDLAGEEQYTCFDKGGFDGFGFCWIEVKEYNKELNTIKVESCYWGLSCNDIVEYDFSNPEEVPYVEISREYVEDKDEDCDCDNYDDKKQ